MANNEINCPECKFVNSTEKKFCSWCGACLILVCPSCRCQYSVGDKFCGNCGEDLSNVVKGTSMNWFKCFKSWISKWMLIIISKIPTLGHCRDYTDPPEFGGRVILHTFHGLAIAFSPLVHWGLTIAYVWIFIRYEENEDIHTRDEAWKDYYGALIGIFLGGFIIFMLDRWDIISFLDF
jgi:hypothetical protein